MERRGLLGLAGLLTLLGARPLEPLRLRFREEFSLPDRKNITCTVNKSHAKPTGLQVKSNITGGFWN